MLKFNYIYYFGGEAMKSFPRLLSYLAITTAWIASSLGIVNASPIVPNPTQDVSAVKADSPVYLQNSIFANSVNEKDSQIQQMYHYSHSSHSSHYSHSSHTSHYSSYDY